MEAPPYSLFEEQLWVHYAFKALKVSPLQMDLPGCIHAITRCECFTIQLCIAFIGLSYLVTSVTTATSPAWTNVIGFHLSRSMDFHHFVYNKHKSLS